MTTTTTTITTSTTLLVNPSNGLTSTTTTTPVQTVALAAVHQAEDSTPNTLDGRAQLANQKDLDFISFTEIPTSAFANAYPCKFEFGGKDYQSATACYLAQHYINEPEKMELFTECETAEEAQFLDEQLSVNPEQKQFDFETMMHVLRAKFGQTPNLKEQLLSTGNLYIVCQGYDLLMSAGFNDEGQNQLGICLMQLRAEYRGHGIVPKTLQYEAHIQGLRERCSNMLTDFPYDLVGQIFEACWADGDITGLQALACTNLHFYNNITAIAQGLKLEDLCPLLKIIIAEQAQGCGFTAVPAPIFPKLGVIKAYQAMAPQIEGDAGVTYFNFTLPKDLTFNQIVAIAKIQGIDVNIYWKEILPEIGDVPIKQAFPCMLANNVFKDSRNKTYDAQCALAEEHGCELPSVEQYAVQIVLIQKIFNQCLFGQNPMTYGRASTHVKGFPLVVGGSAPGCLRVTYSGCGYKRLGVGGWRKF